MFYTYILRSLSHPSQCYIGSTSDLKSRLAKHHSGEVPHTTKFKPWKVEAYFAFETKEKGRSLRALPQVWFGPRSCPSPFLGCRSSLNAVCLFCLSKRAEERGKVRGVAARNACVKCGLGEAGLPFLTEF